MLGASRQTPEEQHQHQQRGEERSGWRRRAPAEARAPPVHRGFQHLRDPDTKTYQLDLHSWHQRFVDTKAVKMSCRRVQDRPPPPSCSSSWLPSLSLLPSADLPAFLRSGASVQRGAGELSAHTDGRGDRDLLHSLNSTKVFGQEEQVQMGVRTAEENFYAVGIKASGRKEKTSEAVNLQLYADKDPGVVASHSKKEEVLVLGQWQAQESGHGRGGAVFRPPRSNGTEVGAGGPGAWVSPEELPDCQSSDPG
ncbi:hypothetical protein FQA47_013629 [Oryzias melastigma]|uniref:Uncharacterized protein n=1 Tax=Oryzias melastigma TaxID=30732 RepID=A0A834F2V8_ORYME|nr:hypothetical protein FQA47_013629 [Oryzias melastigma]